MSKFKIGDKVIWIGMENKYVDNKSIYVIEKINEDWVPGPFKRIFIKCNDSLVRSGTEEFFILAKNKKKFKDSPYV